MVNQRKSKRSMDCITEEQPSLVNGTSKKTVRVNGTKHVDLELHNPPLREVQKKNSEAVESSTLPNEKKPKSALTIREKAQKLADGETSTKVKTQTAVGGSLAILLTQGLMANDAQKIDSVLRDNRLEVIQATLLDLQVMHVIPLLKTIEQRLRTRAAVEIRPWIRWIQCAFSMHMSYLVSQRTLERDLGGLLDWMRARVGHQQKLLSLHGKLSVIAEQIERRTNKTGQVAAQPLIVFNNDDVMDSDLDDMESMGSEESGASSQEDWWDEKEIRDEDDDDDSEDDDAESAGSPDRDDEDDDDDMAGDDADSSGDDDDDDDDEDMDTV